MTAALSYDYDLSLDAAAPAPVPSVPAELRVLFEESAKMKASFSRLSDRDRRGFLRYIDESRSVMTRERRAAIVAMSLIGLARDIADDGSIVTR